MSKEDFISVINGLDIKTIEGFYLKITNSDNVRGQIEQGLDCIDLEERVNEVKEHLNYIIGITDDERVLAECNLIEEILNKEDKLSQYYKQKERIDKAIEYIEKNNIYVENDTLRTGKWELLDILRGEDNE